MTTTSENLSAAEQAVLDEAHKVNEQRMQAIKDLAAIVAQRVELEEQLKDNTKEERRAIREAEKAGWTPAQIKRFMKPPRTQSKSQSSASSPDTSPREQPSTEHS